MLRFCNFRAVSFWPIRVFSILHNKTRRFFVSSQHVASLIRLSKFDMRFWRFFFSSAFRTPLSLFVEYISHREYKYSDALLFSIWFLSRSWCLRTLWRSSLRRSFFTEERFTWAKFLRHASIDVTHNRRYHLAEPRKWVMAVALANYTGWQELFV